jgi:membrane protease YdiL (CAAX protease family)
MEETIHSVPSKSKRISSLIQLLIAVAGVYLTVFGLRLFNQYLLMSFLLPVRIVLMIVTQWTLMIVPGILMLVNKEKPADLGFRKEKLLRQIGIGALLAAAMSLVFTVLPIALGFKDMVGGTSYKYAWQFTFEFFYCILGVALAEEIIFRGYIFRKLLEIKSSRWLAILVSSVLFGLFHVFGGNWIQVLMTSVIGLIYCIFREKIKSCTLLSLIIAHGVYDALIVLWAGIL